MEQSPGYVAQGKQKSSSQEGHIGLKQSSRVWFEKFRLTISVIGFHRCHSYYFVFVQRTKSYIVVLAVYIDDFSLTGSDSAGY